MQRTAPLQPKLNPWDGNATLWRVRESEIQKIRYIHSQRSCGIVVFVTARKLPEFLCRSIRHPLPYRHRIFGEGQLSDGST